MSATEAVTASGMAPDEGVRIARAVGEALRLLDRVRNRALQGEDITRLREAFSCLAEAEQRVQEGAIDNITWWYVGEAVLLADQVGRSPLL
jgi:hypothetical protein